MTIIGEQLSAPTEGGAPPKKPPTWFVHGAWRVQTPRLASAVVLEAPLIRSETSPST